MTVRTGCCFTVITIGTCWAVPAALHLKSCKPVRNQTIPGLMPHWILTGVTRDDALAYYDGELGGLKCSFCGKRGFEIERGWVEGNDAAICATCVGKFHARLQSRDSE
jgi:hypothetical protein